MGSATSSASASKNICCRSAIPHICHKHTGGASVKIKLCQILSLKMVAMSKNDKFQECGSSPGCFGLAVRILLVYVTSLSSPSSLPSRPQILGTKSATRDQLWQNGFLVPFQNSEC